LSGGATRDESPGCKDDADDLHPTIAAIGRGPPLGDLHDDHPVLDDDEEGHEEGRAGNVGEHEFVLTEHSVASSGGSVERRAPTHSK
jgi:hypothetical protein